MLVLKWLICVCPTWNPLLTTRRLISQTLDTCCKLLEQGYPQQTMTRNTCHVCICPVNVLRLESQRSFCSADGEMGSQKCHWARNARVSWGCMPYQDIILYPTTVEMALKVLLGSAMPGLKSVLVEPDATHNDLKHTRTVLAYTLWDEEGQWYE